MDQAGVGVRPGAGERVRVRLPGPQDGARWAVLPARARDSVRHTAGLIVAPYDRRTFLHGDVLGVEPVVLDGHVHRADAARRAGGNG